MDIRKIIFWIILGLFVILFWKILMNALTVVLIILAFYLLIKIIKQLKDTK